MQRQGVTSAGTAFGFMRRLPTEIEDGGGGENAFEMESYEGIAVTDSVHR